MIVMKRMGVQGGDDDMGCLVELSWAERSRERRGGPGEDAWVA